MSASSSGRSSRFDTSRAASSSASGESEIVRAFGLPAAPSRPALEELGPRRPEHEQRYVACPLGQAIDEVEHRLVGPVEILEHADERPFLGQELEESPPGCGCFIGTGRSVVGQSGEGPELPLEPLRLRWIGCHLRDHAAQLLPGLVDRVALEDPCLRLHDLGQRPEGHAVAVGQGSALTPGDERLVLVDSCEELEDEPALADAGDSDEGDELRRSLLPNAPERRDQQVDLPATADKRCRRTPREIDAEASPGGQGLPNRQRFGLALRGDRLGLAEVEHVCCGAVGLLADQHTVERRRRLQAGRRIDDVAGCHRLTLTRPGGEGDQSLSGVDGDPNLQLVPLLHRPVANCECCANPALGIVLVRHRCTEQCHDRIADEFLDRSSEALELAPHVRVVRAEQCLHILRVETLRACREPDEVDEEHGDDLPLLPRRCLRSGRRPAERAVRKLPRQVPSAARASAHRPSLRPRPHGLCS